MYNVVELSSESSLTQILIAQLHLLFLEVCVYVYSELFVFASEVACSYTLLQSGLVFDKCCTCDHMQDTALACGVSHNYHI